MSLQENIKQICLKDFFKSQVFTNVVIRKFEKHGCKIIHMYN
jgi:hypothetical protein